VKHVFYFSLSANPWQRSALLDSALTASKETGLDIHFLQSYTPERSSMDLPLASRADYLLARFQDWRLSKSIENTRIQFATYNLYGDRNVDELSDFDKKTGYEETITKTRDSKPCRIHTQDLILHYASCHQLAYSQALTFLEAKKPDLIYIFNGRFYREKAVWRAARELGIEIKFIERFAPSWGDRYFEFAGPVHDIQYRCTVMRDFWENFTSSFGIAEAQEISDKWFSDRALGISQSFTTGQSKDFQIGYGDRKVITFFHSSEDELFTTNLGSTVWTDQIEFLIDLEKALEKMGDCHLIIRVHPNLRHKSDREIGRWRNFESTSRKSKVTFIMHDSPIKTYDLLKKSDYVITFGSTIGVEASHFGKPSLLVSRAFHEDLNVVEVIRNINQLVETVNSGISQEKLQDFKENAAIYGLFQAIGGIKFRNLIRQDAAVQDPIFSYAKVKLGSLRTISLLRRIEGSLVHFFSSKTKFHCACQIDV
jgi:hypothetical protein